MINFSKDVILEREELVKQGLEKSWPLVGISLKQGILLVALNPQLELIKKIVEIQNGIVLGAVGRAVEFEELKKLLISEAYRIAHLYSVKDVEILDLSKFLSQALSQAFYDLRVKPLEVEIVLVEVGRVLEEDKIIKVRSDGTRRRVEKIFWLGGKAEIIGRNILGKYSENLSLNEIEEILKLEILKNTELDKPPKFEIVFLERDSQKFLRRENR